MQAFAASAATAVATAQNVASSAAPQHRGGGDRTPALGPRAARRHPAGARGAQDRHWRARGGRRIRSPSRRCSKTPSHRSTPPSATSGAIITDLRPAALDALGVVPAVEALVERAKGRSQVDISVRADLGVRSRTVAGATRPAIELAVYRLVQEGLTNAVRHADASSIQIEMAERDGLLTVAIRDDGSGFDAAETHSGFGLIGMRERVAFADGTMAVESSAAGTRLASPSRRRVGRRVAARWPRKTWAQLRQASLTALRKRSGAASVSTWAAAPARRAARAKAGSPSRPTATSGISPRLATTSASDGVAPGGARRRSNTTTSARWSAARLARESSARRLDDHQHPTARLERAPERRRVRACEMASSTRIAEAVSGSCRLSAHHRSIAPAGAPPIRAVNGLQRGFPEDRPGVRGRGARASRSRDDRDQRVARNASAASRHPLLGAELHAATVKRRGAGSSAGLRERTWGFPRTGVWRPRMRRVPRQPRLGEKERSCHEEQQAARARRRRRGFLPTVREETSAATGSVG